MNVFKFSTAKYIYVYGCREMQQQKCFELITFIVSNKIIFNVTITYYYTRHEVFNYYLE